LLTIDTVCGEAGAKSCRLTVCWAVPCDNYCGGSSDTLLDEAWLTLDVVIIPQLFVGHGSIRYSNGTRGSFLPSTENPKTESPE
jgi:hypothetical protein